MIRETEFLEVLQIDVVFLILRSVFDGSSFNSDKRG